MTRPPTDYIVLYITYSHSIPQLILQCLGYRIIVSSSIKSQSRSPLAGRFRIMKMHVYSYETTTVHECMDTRIRVIMRQTKESKSTTEYDENTTIENPKRTQRSQLNLPLFERASQTVSFDACQSREMRQGRSNGQLEPLLTRNLPSCLHLLPSCFL